jgi:peptide/nickel transport system ATP-binding protein
VWLLWRLPANHNCWLDEPTALDVTVQRKLSVVKDIQQETGMSIIFISHDLSLVSEIAHQFWWCIKENCGARRSKADIQNPQHNYKSLNCFASFFDFRLKRLPTIQNFLDDTINAEVLTREDRTRFHNKYTVRHPFWKSLMLRKNIFYKAGFFGKKSGFKAMMWVLNCMMEKH